MGRALYDELLATLMLIRNLITADQKIQNQNALQNVVISSSMLLNAT